MSAPVTIVAITILVFVAAFQQSLSGFGFAIIIMPLITFVLGLKMAAPLVALTALTVYTINLVRYRQAVNVREVLRLAMSSLVGVPVGIWVLNNVNEDLIKQVMGLILIAYGLYSVARPAASWVLPRRWVYPAGFFAGCLGGAYNTPGPPVIIYGALRQWPKDEFRAVLQALFFVNGAMVVTSHWLARHMTADVLRFYLYAIPALALGILAGSRVDSKVDRARFRTIVTVMILALGVALATGVG